MTQVIDMMATMADTIAGRFSLLEPIASGGSGTVWFAHDRKVDSICAAKVMRQRDSADLLRFVRENSVRIDHPHVLAPYAWAAEDADVVLAMPVITGGTLSGVIGDNGPLTPALVAEIIRQVLDGLAHIHASGWIHRDLKPANIMVDAEVDYPHVLIADFGIALHTDEPRLTQTGVVYGTPGYLAPEVFDGADPATPQDIWAVGAIAWTLLGSTPRAFAQERHRLRGDLMRAHPYAATETLLDVLDAMVDADPGRRPSALEALGVIPSPGTRDFFTADGERFVPLRVLEPPQADAAPSNPQAVAAPVAAAGSPPPWPRTLVLPARPQAAPRNAVAPAFGNAARRPDGAANPMPSPPFEPARAAPPAAQGPVHPAAGRPAAAPPHRADADRSTRGRRRGWLLVGGLGAAGLLLVIASLAAAAAGLL